MTELSAADKFRARTAAWKASKEAAQPPAEPDASAYADLIPSFGDDAPAGKQRSHLDLQIDQLVDGLQILDAYDRWFPQKNREEARGRTESIKVGCPVPGHTDNAPSAWVNTIKNTFNCGVCEVGGDVYDLAAYKFGIPTPNYKTDTKLYGKLREEIVNSLGLVVVNSPGGGYLNRPSFNLEELPASDAGQPVAEATSEQSETGGATVTDIGIVEAVAAQSSVMMPGLNWRPLVKENTFLHTWMEIGCKDDIPEEYYFWNGLLAIGMALGRNTALFDRRRVYGNVFLCIVGPTGSGKSQAKGLLDDLLAVAFPASAKGGVELINSPSSGEVLIKTFDRTDDDPRDPKLKIPVPVRGIIDYNEMSVMSAKMNRNGSTLEGVLQDFYDAKGIIGTTSVTGGKVTAHDALASLITTTQPKSLGRLLTGDQVSSGFVNRFVFASGTPKKRIAIGGELLDPTPAVLPLQAIRGRYAATEMIQWDDDAFDMFTDFFHGTLEKAKEDSELLSRIDLLAKKLILLLTANEMLSHVSVEVVARVKEMFGYLFGTYGVAEDQIGNDIYREIEDGIIAYIKKFTEKRKMGPSAADIINAHRHKKTWSRKYIEGALRTLAALGLIEELKVPLSGPGAKTVRYFLAS